MESVYFDEGWGERRTGLDVRQEEEDQECRADDHSEGDPATPVIPGRCAVFLTVNVIVKAACPVSIPNMLQRITISDATGALTNLDEREYPYWLN